jgi:hypothetical protein
VKKPKQQRVKASTIAVRKHRAEKAKKSPWEITVDSCCDSLRRYHALTAEGRLEALRNEARAMGARPYSHLFDFVIGEEVHVLQSSCHVLQSF